MEADHMAMTPRERFLTTFRGEMPDRVPVTLFIQDQGHFINQVYPDVDPWDFETLQQENTLVHYGVNPSAVLRHQI
jgi:hypothetical protein